MKVGYARVSTKQQGESLDQQIANLKKVGCKEVYSEVVSGASSKRKKLTKLLSKIQSGDILVIAAIDRLGRSLKDLIAIITNLQEKGVKFQSLKEQVQF